MAPQDINHPLFVRLYGRGREAAIQRGENEHRRRLLEGLSGRVVEVGPGDGANFAFYPAEVSEVIAFEPEPRFRVQSADAGRGAPVRVHVRPGRADELDLEDGSVDAVVTSLVLCSVPDQAAALDEAHRVLRPGGELRFYEHVQARHQPLRAILAAADRSGLWPRLAGGCHPARDTYSAIEAAGFTIERCDRFGFSASPGMPKIPHILGLARRA